MNTARSTTYHPRVDALEGRLMLTFGGAMNGPPTIEGQSAAAWLGSLKTYYGLAGLTFATPGNPGISATGQGQTIVIISEARDATYTSSGQPGWAASGLARFSEAMGLPDDLPGSGPGFDFELVNQEGDADPAHLPAAATASTPEFDLDTQAAHAFAIHAEIVDIVLNPPTASSSNADNIDLAIATALDKFHPTAISLSISAPGLNLDFPVAENGTTYVQSAGDSGGGEQLGYGQNLGPAKATGDFGGLVRRNKPIDSVGADTVMVGGTSLSESGGKFVDVAWGDGHESYLSGQAKSYFSKHGGSGGGYNPDIARPDYQVDSPFVAANAKYYPKASGGKRLGPDVSMMSKPGIGVLVYEPQGGSSAWEQISGTSLSAPMFAAVMAVVGQGRAVAGLPALSSADTLHRLYQEPGYDFADITEGSNGYRARPGYDLASGRGAVQAGLIRDLASAPVPGPR